MQKKDGRTYRRFFLILLITGIFAGCENKVQDLPSNAKRAIVPEEAEQVVSYMSEGALVKGKLTAPYMLRFQKADSPYFEFPRSLHVDFYNSAMVIESQMDALYGKFLQTQNKVYLRDSV